MEIVVPQSIEEKQESTGWFLEAVGLIGVLLLVCLIGLPVAIWSKITGDKTPWNPYVGD